MSKKSKLGLLLVNEFINKHIEGFTNSSCLMIFLLPITMFDSESSDRNEQEKFRELRK